MMAMMLEYVVNPEDVMQANEKWIAAFAHIAGITKIHMLYASKIEGLVQFFFYYNGQSTELVVTRDMFENMSEDEIEMHIGQRLVLQN